MTCVARRTLSSWGSCARMRARTSFLAKAVAGDDAREPRRRRRGDDDQAVQLLVAAALDQQRRLVQHQPVPRLGERVGARARQRLDARVHDRLQPLAAPSASENTMSPRRLRSRRPSGATASGQAAAISAWAGWPGACTSRARRVRVDDGDAARREHPGHGRLARADVPGQSDQCRPPSRRARHGARCYPRPGLTRVPDVDEAAFVAEARDLGDLPVGGGARDRHRGAVERRQVDAAEPAGGPQGAGAHVEDAGTDARAGDVLAALPARREGAAPTPRGRAAPHRPARLRLREGLAAPSAMPGSR